MTTTTDIREWLTKAQGIGCTHVIVVCDTYDYSDYPVFVMPEVTDELTGQQHADIEALVQEYNAADMSKVMEVYAMHLGLEEQLHEHRAWHPETKPEALVIQEEPS